MGATLQCPRCHAALTPDRLRAATFVPCSNCGTPLRAVAFPALHAAPAARTDEAAATEGEAACYFHATRRAEATCDECGRFICGLCEVAVDSRPLCPPCLTLGHAAGRLPRLESSRARWDSRCLLLAVVPLLFWPLTLLTAPATLFLAFRFRRAPGSLVNPGRGRLWLAVGIAALELGGWGALGLGLATGAFD